jgi:hypothetical protein
MTVSPKRVGTHSCAQEKNPTPKFRWLVARQGQGGYRDEGSIPSCPGI